MVSMFDIVHLPAGALLLGVFGNSVGQRFLGAAMADDE
jgi:hypothetical protein